jgi:hypothetical protein
MTEPVLTPPWKQALRELLASGELQYGQCIKTVRLAQLFRLSEPVTAADERAFRLAFFTQFECLQRALLEDHRIDLAATRHKSYRVTPPQEQAQVAQRDLQHELKKTLRKATRRVAYVRLEELSDSQRQANATAQSRVAALAALMTRPRVRFDKN